MGKKIKIVLAGLIVMLGLTACGKSVEQQIQEQLDLGQRYLTEANYEEAIAAFQKVLELEPKNIEAYHGLASAYTEWILINPDEQLIKEALEVLEDGYEESLDERLKQALTRIYEKIIELAEEKADYDTMIEYYQKLIKWYPEQAEKLADLYLKLKEFDQAEEVLEEVLDQAEDKEGIEGKLEEIKEDKKRTAQETEIKNKYSDKIYTMLQYLDGHNGELSKEVLLDDGFIGITEGLDEPIIEEYNGKYVGIYPGGYVYYGEMKDGVREGHGEWILCETSETGMEGMEGVRFPTYMHFSGIWGKDYPNGYGESEYVWLEYPEDMFTYYRDSGNYVNGYLDGFATEISKDPENEEYVSNYMVHYGKPEVIWVSEEGDHYAGDPAEASDAIAEGEIPDGWFIVSEDMIFGVHGAMKP